MIGRILSILNQPLGVIMFKLISTVLLSFAFLFQPVSAKENTALTQEQFCTSFVAFAGLSEELFSRGVTVQVVMPIYLGDKYDAFYMYRMMRDAYEASQKSGDFLKESYNVCMKDKDLWGEVSKWSKQWKRPNTEK